MAIDVTIGHQTYKLLGITKSGLRLSSRLFDFLGQDRQYLKQVADDAVVCDVEDRCIGIFVDGHDAVGAAHTGLMLDSAGNTAGDIKFRSNDFAALANLMSS